MSGAFMSVASLSAKLISPFDLSKEPGDNTAVAGVMIGPCAPASNLWPAIQATLSHIACLADLVGASDAPQFNDVYAFRKYEGDAPCVLVLKPTPCVYVPSTVMPAPAEALPGVVRDCKGRAWTSVTNEYGCADAVDDPATGKTTYTFAATYGDGTSVPDAKPFSFSIPTIRGVPDCPQDGKVYRLSCTSTVSDGKPEWVAVADCATTDEKGPVELATTDETVAGTDDERATTAAGVKALISSLSLSTVGGDVVLSCGGTEIARTTAPAGSGGGDTVTLNKDASGNLASISVNGGDPCPIPSGGGGGEVTTAAVCAALAGMTVDAGGIISSDPSRFGSPFIGLPGTGQAGNCLLQVPNDGG